MITNFLPFQKIKFGKSSQGLRLFPTSCNTEGVNSVELKKESESEQCITWRMITRFFS